MAPHGRRDRLLIRIANWFLRRTSKPVLSGIGNITRSGMTAIDAARQSTAKIGGADYHVHDPARCEGQPCCIHNPSDHHMRDWTQHWRDDLRLMERICPHGVGHPDPDHIAYVERCFGAEHADGEAVHGCDGCCSEKDQ